jgi:hypothetical protein
MVIWGFSVTPDRAEKVCFVRPFYAAEGGRLFAPPAMLPALEAGITRVNVCVQNGSYLEPALVQAGAVVVEVASAHDYAPAIADGRCAAGATDDFAPLDDGLAVVPGLPLLSPTSYAVAVSRDAAADDLALRVSGALVNLYTGDTGGGIADSAAGGAAGEDAASPIVAIEKLWFGKLGVEPGAEVPQLSDAITMMAGCPAGAPAASSAPGRGLAAAAATAAAVAALL